ncbi:MAG: sigma-54 dependent transcriptional regulator [Acidobacteriota bacterium]|jgi:DNA-binding NtrC family response regulator
MKTWKILIVDDDPDLRKLFATALRHEGYEVLDVDSGERALDLGRTGSPDLVLLDLYLPGLGGLEVLQQITKICPAAQVVIMTGRGDVTTAVQAMKLGASDYLLKPIEVGKLRTTLEVVLGRREKASESNLTKRIIGESPRMKEVWTQITHYALPDVSIMLLGESGTGKELFARAIHERSKRGGKPFIALDCATLPDTLVESEIFGHEKGAFTGAVDRKAGKFELADGGTLFLDEIGNLPLNVQAKLLRAVQERCIEYLGGQRPIPVDVRIVSATNLDLLQAMQKGTFRADLYYRLAEVAVSLPPLREREGDIRLLANFFVEEFNRRFGREVKGISDSAWSALLAYRWPGNVRELQNAIKGSLLAADEFISVEQLPEYLRHTSGSSIPMESHANAFREDLRRRIDAGLAAGSVDFKSITANYTEEIERELLTILLERQRFTQIKLSELLGLDPKTLRVKLQKFGLKTR